MPDTDRLLAEPSLDEAVSAIGRPVTRVLAISDSDSRMKWTVAVAEALMTSDVDESSVLEVVSLTEGAVPTKRQLDENRVRVTRRVVDTGSFDAVLLEGWSVIVCNTVGSRLHLLTEAVRARWDGASPDRPIVITGYAGVVYERHLEGALWRAAADIVCCNSTIDHERFTEAYDGLGLDSGVLVRTGLGVLGMAAGEQDVHVPATDRTSPPLTVTFAVQPDVPRSLDERRYVLERLTDYARTHPDRSMVVKLRSRPDEETTHRERHHFEEIQRRYFTERPANLRFEYGLMREVLERTDLLITVSSTAAMEAVVNGCPAAILTDFGVRENLGNHFFVGSGLLRSMDQLIADDLPSVEPDWLDRNGLGGGDSLAALVARVAELRLVGPGPVPPAFYGSTNTPYTIRRLAETGSLRAARDGGADHIIGRVVDRFDAAARPVYRRLLRWARR